ncbi:hypothetical protein RRG08_040019 [Elysia crispata]|uniref:GPS domain-containing protein n=1 Tax=Elysia crispata TaxID=231223 RepID=A0AAE0Z7T0_9GAST|nr:hypothetical protein RRG08_040019 [Elysia crispata]
MEQGHKVYVTGRAYFLTEGLRLNYGFVKIFAETKTEHQRLTLTPKDDPIVIEFEKFRRKKKVLSPHLYVIEENDVVIDSTCVLFSVLQSELYNLTMTLELSGNYNYSFAAILAKYPSEFIRFAEIKFERIGKNTSFFVPRVSHMHKFRYPLSRAMFMVRVPPTPASHRARARAQAARAGPRQSSSRQSGTSRNVTAVKLQIQVLNSQCYYYSRGKWRSDGNCENVHIGEHNKMKCRCHVDAPFAAQKVSALSSLILFNPNAINYHGPTVIPGIFVLMCLLIFLYYAYWSYFQDIRERNNAQTHVIQDMYNPSSADQYLVCISTGVLPGSGTDANVGFLLVGELGSHKFVVPEGSFCYSVNELVRNVLVHMLDWGGTNILTNRALRMLYRGVTEILTDRALRMLYRGVTEILTDRALRMLYRGVTEILTDRALRMLYRGVTEILTDRALRMLYRGVTEILTDRALRMLYRGVTEILTDRALRMLYRGVTEILTDRALRMLYRGVTEILTDRALRMLYRGVTEILTDRALRMLYRGVTEILTDRALRMLYRGVTEILTNRALRMLYRGVTEILTDRALRMLYRGVTEILTDRALRMLYRGVTEILTDRALRMLYRGVTEILTDRALRMLYRGVTEILTDRALRMLYRGVTEILTDRAKNMQTGMERIS